MRNLVIEEIMSLSVLHSKEKLETMSNRDLLDLLLDMWEHYPQ